ncbi:VWA domain-containing protein [uncultured Shewanella sp.]|uniref:VWA domain-containing protein n=1 Tax=uncultured Shewanella sp. TaxID=173975 RepID=UPI0026018B63|nr:VWA domain-containing protein [uncultured Shewanella sp.]
MNNIDKEGGKLLYEIHSQHGELLSSSESVSNEVERQLASWKRHSRRSIELEFPFYYEASMFSQFDFSLHSVTNFKRGVDAYKSLCLNANMNYNAFWDNELAQYQASQNKQTVATHRSDTLASFNLLSQEWSKLLEQLKSTWELEQIQFLRSEFIKKTLQKLALLDELYSCVKSLGLEPGIFFDLSKGGLGLSDIAKIKSWLEYLKNDEGVQALLELMGRVMQVKQSEKQEEITQVVYQEVWIPDTNSREEIVGIKLGRDLEHTLPNELSLMSDPVTSILFDLKYVESSLMCFDMVGLQQETISEEERIFQTVSEDENKGPIVICVDTSGSMQGAPETIAKALTLLMVLKAKNESRACYLINFSTQIETLNLSGPFTMERLMTFLQKSFYGGTDVAPAIQQGINVMSSDDYKNADMLIISDFIMSGLPSSLRSSIEELRKSGNKFYSLVVDSCCMEHRLKTLFDHEWVYDPCDSSVKELLSFTNVID